MRMKVETIVVRMWCAWLVSACVGLPAAVRAAPWPEAQVYRGGELLPFACRTLDSIDAYEVDPTNLELSTYGGWKKHRVAATGFFRVEQIDGRWWAIDPDGYLYLHKALNSVHLDDFTADQIYLLLPQYGFNGTGSWTDEEVFLSPLKAVAPLAYCPKISFLALYRRQRNPRIEMPVFDAAFPAYCNQLAQGFAPYVNDPHVFGYFSDNELAWRDEGLAAHLAITDTGDANYTTAIDFLTARGKTAGDWDTEDRNAYMALMAERYYSVVSAAIRAVDPNHMYIGSRCHSTEKTIEAFLTNAGQYVDIFTINHYNRWGARRVALDQMSEWAGRPLMITEFYAMQDLPGDENGAGWLVLDQPSRGWFYQHYLSTHAESGDLVGWHWFKFQDDGNGNKGVVDPGGTLYTNLLQQMQQMNNQLYDFIAHVDARPTPDVALLPEADAFFKGPENFGADPELLVKNSATSVHRESYLRWDLSTVDFPVALATVRLSSVATGSESGRYQAELVADNGWDEMTITRNNNPTGSTVLASWSHGDDVEIDVTGVLQDALALDQHLSIRIVSTLNNGSIPRYGSRENTHPLARPQLLVYAVSKYVAWAMDKGLTEGVNDGYGDDPDDDGMHNLLEFALGASPLTGDADLFLPRLEMPPESDPDSLHYIYARRLDRETCGLSYTPQTAAELTAPAWNTGTLTEIGAGDIDAEFEAVTNRVATDIDAHQFIQLKVTVDP